MKKILILLSLCLFNRCYEYIDINTYDDIDNINQYKNKNYVIPNYYCIDEKYAYIYIKDRMNYYDCNKIY